MSDPKTAGQPVEMDDDSLDQAQGGLLPASQASISDGTSNISAGQGTAQGGSYRPIIIKKSIDAATP